MTIFFEVPGVPQPQGSTRSFVKGGKVITTSANKNLRPWRDSVILAAKQAVDDNGVQRSWRGVPVHVDVVFFLPRPKSHFGKKGLRPSAPKVPIVRPDCDKLIRGVLDALKQAGVIHDDSQVVSIAGGKHYAGDEPCTKVWVSGG